MSLLAWYPRAGVNSERGAAVRRIVDNIGLWLGVANIVVALVFLMLPIGVAIMMSFDARGYLGPFPPPEYSFRWYESFFSDDYYLHGLKTSLILAVITTIVSTVSGVSAAIALDRYTGPGKQALESLFLSPLVVPAVVIGFALLLFFALIGVFDGFTRLLGGHIIITFPYTVRTTLAGLVGIRKTLTEAAMSLGANERQAFWDVTFPLARTGMVAGSVFAFAFSMDDVAVSLFLTSPDTYTLPVAMVSMMRTNFDLTIAAAAVVLMMFTLLLIMVLDWFIGLERLIGKGVFRS
jgi:putative spermidine/putrescine transport system permease protein